MLVSGRTIYSMGKAKNNGWTKASTLGFTTRAGNMGEVSIGGQMAVITMENGSIIR